MTFHVVSTKNMRLLVLALIGSIGFAQSAADVRREIESQYAKAIEALRTAKSMEDLDELNRSFDTQDWQSIVPGQQPQSWADLRKYGFEAINARFDSMKLQVETFDLSGDTAVLTGKLHVVQNGSALVVPLTETWRRTPLGWKRQIHHKLALPMPDPEAKR